jgi:hypothetical protein
LLDAGIGQLAADILLLVERLIFFLLHNIIVFFLHLLALEDLAANLFDHAKRRRTCHIAEKVIEPFQIPKIISHCTLICHFDDRRLVQFNHIQQIFIHG